MNKIDEAVKCFKDGYNCSQAVFSTYCEQFGLDRDTALKISCPFGGGMARMGGTCGAVTGAFMVIGLKEGKHLPDDNEAKETTYRHVREFTEKFEEIYGSIQCKDILNCDINTENGRKFASEHGLFENICPGFVCDAARILEDVLELNKIEE